MPPWPRRRNTWKSPPTTWPDRSAADGLAGGVGDGGIGAVMILASRARTAAVHGRTLYRTNDRQVAPGPTTARIPKNTSVGTRSTTLSGTRPIHGCVVGT